jgi:hypothetical protein
VTVAVQDGPSSEHRCSLNHDGYGAHSSASGIP